MGNGELVGDADVSILSMSSPVKYNSPTKMCMSVDLYERGFRNRGRGVLIIEGSTPGWGRMRMERKPCKLLVKVRYYENVNNNIDGRRGGNEIKIIIECCSDKDR